MILFSIRLVLFGRSDRIQKISGKYLDHVAIMFFFRFKSFIYIYSLFFLCTKRLIINFTTLHNNTQTYGCVIQLEKFALRIL